MAQRRTTKRSGGNPYKVACLVIAAVLVIAFIISAIGSSVNGKPFANANIATWFGRQTEDDGNGDQTPGDDTNDPANPDNPDKPGNGSIVPTSGTHFLMEVNDNERIQVAASYSRTSAVAPASNQDGEYTITANVNPLYADVRDVEWTFRFQNPDSAWASGKQATNYVRFTDAGGYTIKVWCSEPFGEPIVIRCTSDDNPNIYADCICDYVKRVEGITFSELLTFPESSFNYSFEYTAYTVDSSLAFSVESTLWFDENFANYVAEYVRNYCNTSEVTSGTSIGIRADYTAQTLTAVHPELWYWVDYTDDFDSDSADFDEISRAVRLAIGSWSGNMFYFRASCVSSFEGSSYGTFEEDIWIRFDYNSVKIPVTSLTLSVDHIYFDDEILIEDDVFILEDYNAVWVVQ